MTKELVVLSGKGGTGKTSLVASFAVLAERSVLADCDVDAANLHLVLAPRTIRSADFSGGRRAAIDRERCSGCGLCERLCRFDAVRSRRTPAGLSLRVDPIACEGCGVCARFCPVEAIAFDPAISGRWFVADTRFGPLVHAKLGPGEGNSGKLVTVIRHEAQALAAQQALELIIVDGSPGIGCPVIASMTGVDLVLAVTEPTLSGLHDLERILDLGQHFGVPTFVCVNRWDINATITAQIEERTTRRGARLADRIRYDRAVTDAQIAGQPLVSMTGAGAAQDVRRLWKTLREALETTASASQTG